MYVSAFARHNTRIERRVKTRTYHYRQHSVHVCVYRMLPALQQTQNGKTSIRPDKVPTSPFYWAEVP